MAWAQALWEENYPDGLFEPEFFKWGAANYAKDQILNRIKKCQAKLYGSGWVGDSVEKNGRVRC